MAIGTTAAIIGSAALGAGASYLSSSKQSGTIQDASDASIAEQRRQFDTMLDLTAPRRDAENEALNSLRAALGIDGTPDYSQFYNTPGYQFTRDEALQATERQASATGGLRSGNTLTALQDRVAGLASQNYLSSYLNPLLGVATGNANANAGQNAVNLGVNVGNTLTNAGANRASAIGAGYQGVNSAIQGGLSNYLFSTMVGPQQSQNALYNGYWN